MNRPATAAQEHAARADEDVEPCADCGHPVAVEPLEEPLCDGCGQARAEGGQS